MEVPEHFGHFCAGPWPHHPTDGAGLALTGSPTDKTRFIELLQEFGCSPSATRRILDLLDAGEEKRTTVSYSLNLKKIGVELEKLGVRMKIVAPNDDPPDQTVDDAITTYLKGKGWNIGKLDRSTQKKAEECLIQTLDSMSRIPASLGIYALQG